MAGITHTLALWRSLFTLLQDEDQDVRDKAADFICYSPAQLIATGTHVQYIHTILKLNRRDFRVGLPDFITK